MKAITMLRRAKHNLSHSVVQSQRMGELVPIMCTEVLPGDTFQHSTAALMRLIPLNTPVMHPVDIVVHHWFVPNRLTWTNWESFITGGELGDDASVYPTIASPAGGFPVGSLGDYFGLPLMPAGSAANTYTVSALPFRALGLIFNHYYRDEQLQTPVVVSKAAGADTTTNTTLLNVGWNKDYFTSARPEPQLGPDVYLPLGTSAPVELIAGGNFMQVRNAATGALYPINQIGGAAVTGRLTAQPAGTPELTIDPNGRYIANLTSATAVTINSLRQTSAFQRFYERMNRKGARYDEYLSGLGVKSSDARLQLPEYLGGSTQTVQFSEVLQTAEGTDPVGEMRGHGIAAMHSNAYTRFFEEHGFVISVMFVRPRTMYSQGVPRQWNRRTKFEHWQPELQHVGDQEILNKELYALGTAADATTFGFCPRYDELRRIPNRIAGEMKTVYDTWHMGRIFSSAPALNADFVKSNPTERVFAASTNDTLLLTIRHHLKAHRLVAKTGTSFLS